MTLMLARRVICDPCTTQVPRQGPSQACVETQRHTQFKLWAGHDPRPGLGYRVIAREVIPAGSFVFEYAGDYLPVSWEACCSGTHSLAVCRSPLQNSVPRSNPNRHSGFLLQPEPDRSMEGCDVSSSR